MRREREREEKKVLPSRGLRVEKSGDEILESREEN